MTGWFGLQRWWQGTKGRAQSRMPEPPPLAPVEPRAEPGAWSASRRESLFALFEAALAGGARFARLTEVDDLVDRREGAVFLKHDVHDVDLDGLVGFAEREAELGICGTYFFMPPDHPRTRRAYAFADQVRAMKEVEALGHEIGLHIDPYFQIHDKRKPLADVLHELRRIFTDHGFDYRIGNLHGNSRHKHADRNGFGTAFDLFEEIARQPDYPVLAAMSEESAEIIRTNRVRLVDHGFTHWGDMPVWSARHGIVGTNFLTDNRLDTKGTLEVLVRPATSGAYYLAPRAVPGSRRLAEEGLRMPLPSFESGEPVHAHFPVDDPGLQVRLGYVAMPLLALIHPEFYR